MKIRPSVLGVTRFSIPIGVIVSLAIATVPAAAQAPPRSQPESTSQAEESQKLKEAIARLTSVEDCERE